MGSQSGYFCVTIYAAAVFIENLTSEQLAIDQEFFHSQMPSLPNPWVRSSGLDNPLLDDPGLSCEKDLETYMAEASSHSIDNCDEKVYPNVIHHDVHHTSHSPLFKACLSLSIPNLTQYLRTTQM
jgi:hypothetical protein